MKSPLLIQKNAQLQTRSGLARWVQTLVPLAFLLSFSFSELNATNIVVTSGANTGAGTLRAAITTLNGSAGPHTITFDPAVTVVTFTSDFPTIVKQMTIDGGPSKVIIQCTAGDVTLRPFYLSTGASGSTLTNLDIRGGGYEPIRIDGNLSDITIQNIVCSNSAGDYWNYGLLVTGNATNYLVRNFVMNNIQNGFDAVHFSGTTTNVTIDSVRITQGPGTSGIGMRFGGVSTNMTITRCYIDLNAQETTNEGDYGVLFDSNVNGLTMTGDTVNYSDVYGVLVSGTLTNANIQDLKVKQGGYGDGRGFLVTGAVNGITMNHVLIDMDADISPTPLGDDGNYGIYFSTTVTNANFNNVTVHDCDVRGVFFGNGVVTGTFTNILVDNFNGHTGSIGWEFNGPVSNLIMTNVTINEDVTSTADDGDYGLRFIGNVNGATLTNINVYEADVYGVHIWVDFRNVEWSGGNLFKNGTGIRGDNCNYNRRNVRIHDMKVDSSTTWGIALPVCLGGLADSVAIYNDTITNTGTDGIYLWNGNVQTMYTIKNCVISGNGRSSAAGDGIQINGGPDDVLITQNKIFNNAGLGINLTGNANCSFDGKVPIINSITPNGGGSYTVNYTIPNPGQAGPFKVEFFTNSVFAGAEAEYYVSGADATVATFGTYSTTFTTNSGPAASPKLASLTCTYTKTGGTCGTSEISNALGLDPQGPACVNNGILGWYRADKITGYANGQAMNDLVDFSGNSNKFKQYVAGEQPTYFSGDVSTNFNPSITFSGVNNFEFATGLFPAGTGATMLTAQYHTNIADTWARIYDQNLDDPSLIKQAGDGQIRFWDNGNLGQTFNTRLFVNNVTALRGFDYGNTSGTTNLYFDGVSTASLGATRSPEDGISYIGGLNNSQNWRGKIHELIFYNRELTATELQKINSYMSIKWGVSIDTTIMKLAGAGNDYITSDGTVIWTANTSYYHRIAGIGRDDCDSLLQKQSRNVNLLSPGYVTIGLGTIVANNPANTNNFSADKSFDVWGDDDKSGSTTTTITGDGTITLTGGTCAQYSRLAKTYRVQETGTVGVVQLKFNMLSVKLGKTAADYYLAIHSTSTFNGTIDKLVAASSYDNVTGDLVFDNVNFSANAVSYFTVVGKRVYGPANLTANLKLWLKAEDGIAATNGNPVEIWADQGPGSNDVTQSTVANQPLYYSSNNLINFNPSVKFDGANDLLIKANGALTNATLYTGATLFSVNNSENSAAGQRLFRQVASASDVNLYAPYANRTIFDAPYTDRIDIAHTYFNNKAFALTTAVKDNSGTNTPVGFKQVVYENGKSIATANGTLNYSGNNGSLSIGSNNVGSEFHNGFLGEIIYYSAALTPADRQKINSYLSIKWGISLDQSTAVNYVGADGTVIWDATTNALYKNRITGIGRDDCSDLYQRQSRNQDTTTAFVTMGLGAIEATNIANTNSFGADKTFEIWGDDGVAGASTSTITGDGTITLNPGACGVFRRLGKTFKVQETGTVGNVKVQVSLRGVSLGKVAGDFYLAIHNSATFSGVITKLIPASSYSGANGGVVTFNAVDFANGQYFTVIGQKAQGPANITSNLKLWVRADDGITLNGNNVSGWSDQGPEANDAVQGTGASQPTYNTTSNLINFNPSLSFDGGDWLEPTTSIFGAGNFSYSTFGVVSSATTVADFKFWLSDGNQGCNTSVGFGHYGSQLNNAIWCNNPLVGSFLVNQTYLEGFTRNVTGTLRTTYQNGLSLGTNGSDAFSKINGSGTIGASPNNDIYRWNGAIGEIIAFETLLSAPEQQKINSYLAVKYGLTLDQSTPYDYVSATGTTIWNATTYAAYKNRITGIGRDDCSDLQQKQSKNQDAGSLVTISNGNSLATTNEANSSTFSANDSWLLLGDNNKGLNWTGSGVPINGGNVRLNRVWRVKETGTVGTVYLEAPDNSSPATTKLPTTTNSIYLLVANSGTNGKFSALSGVTVQQMTYDATNMKWYTTYNFTDGDYFTFGSEKVCIAPVGISEGLASWYHATDMTVGAIPANTANAFSDLAFGVYPLNRNASGTATVVAGSATSFNYNRSITLTGNAAFNRSGLANTDVIEAAAGSMFAVGTGNANLFAISSTASNSSGLGASALFNNTTSTYGAGVANTPNIFTMIGSTSNVTGYTNGTAGIASGSIAARAALSYTLGFGQNGSNAAYNNGKISEAFSFNRVLDPEERLILESYLAIKYGQTLSHNYYNADYDGSNAAATTLYDVSTYPFRVFGVGTDTTGCFYQKQATSALSESMLKMSINSSFAAENTGNTAAFLQDRSYVMAGDDNSAFNSWVVGGGANPNTPNIYQTTCETPKRLVRQWKLQGTYTTPNILFAMPDATSSETSKLPAVTLGYSVWMILNENPDFAINAQQEEVAMTLNPVSLNWECQYQVEPGKTKYVTFVMKNNAISTSATAPMVAIAETDNSCTADDSKVLAGAAALLTPTTGDSYIWSNAATTATLSVNPVINTTYTVTVTASNGCTASATSTVTVVPPAVASIVETDNSCMADDSKVLSGDPASLTASGGGTYSWDDASTMAIRIVSPLSSTTYTVTVSDANGCTASASKAITIVTAPNVSLTGASSICVGEMTGVSPTSGGTWASSNPSFATVTNAGVVTGVSAGTVVFTFTSTSSGCESAATSPVTVNATPIVSITGAASICIDGTTTLSPTTGGTWASSDPSIATVTDNGVVTGVSAGSATFIFTNTSTGCVSASTSAVTVNSLPVVNITGSSTVCVGATTTLSPTTGGTWVSSDPAIASVTNAGVVTGVTGGTVTFTFTKNTSPNCSATTATVTVNALTPTSITGASTICVGTTTTLSPTMGGTWVSNNPSVATVTNAGIVTGVSGGSATFTYTDMATGCASPATSPVTIVALPVVSIMGANSICVGSITTLTPNTGGTWASSNPSVASVSMAGVVTGISAGTATFSFTSTATGCVSLPTAPVSVTALPVVDITGSNTICVGTTTMLSPTTGGSWVSSNPAIATVTNSGVVMGVSAGNVTFTFTSGTSPNCSSTTAGVTILALPVASITGVSTICAGSTTTLSPTTGGTWASSNDLVATVTNAGVVTGVSGGSATFTFTLSATGCVSTPTGAVTVNALPVVSIAGLSSICVGASTTLLPASGGTWISSDASVATVTNAGLVTGVSAGTATFTFTNSVTGCVSAPTGTVTVNAIPMVNITGLTSICIGTMSGVSPTTGGTWASTNPAVATITDAGIITGVSAGTATFIFTSSSTGCASAPTPIITVNAPTPVSISGSSSICIGATTTLLPINGTWMSSNPLVATVTNSGIVTGVSAGTVTFIFTNSTTGCESAPTAPITVNGSPSVSIAGASVLCVGATTSLLPNSGGTWVSSDPSVATVTNAGLVTAVSAGTATFTFTNSATGCVSAPTGAVTVNALPTVGITGPTSICVGSTTGLSPTTGGMWISSNPLVATVDNAGVVTAVSAGTATFTFTNTSTGCVSMPTGTVTVNAIPVVSITGSSNICIGFTTALSPTSGGMWVSTNPSVATVTNAGVVTGVSAGMATFIFTNSSTGCVSAATAPITVDPTPIVTIIGVNSICIGAMTSLSPSSGGTWISSNPGVASVTDAGLVTGVSAGTATFTFTNTSTGCVSAPTGLVTVNGTPGVSITGTSTICVNATTTLSPTSGGTWASSNPAVATVTAGGIVTGVSGGSATFTFTNSSSGCVSPATPPIAVNPLPTVSITGGTTICVGSTSSLSPTTGGTWTSSSPAIATVTNAGVVTGISAGSVTFTFINSITSCSAVTLPISVNALPVVSITGVSSICVGSTTTLLPNSGGTWASSNPAVATVTAGGVVTGMSGGTVTFTFTNTSTGCISAATPTVTVNAIPVVSITGSSSICIGSTTALSPTSGGTWASSNPAIATVTNAGVVTGVSAGSVTFSFTNSTTGCVSAATPAVTVNALPVASILGSSNVCVGSTTTLSPTSGGFWTSSNPAIATVTAGGVVTGVSAGTATFIFTNSLTGCASAATAPITVNAAPIVSITGVNSICIGSLTTLSPTSGGTWTSSNPAIATVTLGGVVTGIGAGSVTFTFTNGVTGCTSAPTPMVTVNALPVALLTGSNNICVGSTTTLSPTSGGTWASSNPAVATVTNGGVVTSVGSGTATFTFTSSSTGCASTPTPVLTVTACNSLAAVKVFLSGPYNEGLDLMNDNLRVSNLIPTPQPYGGPQYADFNYTGPETIGAGVLSVTGPNAIVDWVLLELHSAVSPGTVVARKAALVQRDGDVVESSDGVSPVVFVGAVAGNYYVSVRHRNHLGVMTAAPVALSGSSAVSINFTSAATNNYQLAGPTGSSYAQRTLTNGKRALWEGNMSNASGSGNQLQYQGSNSDSDEPYFRVLLDPGNTLVIPNYVVNAYDRADANLDGMVIYQGSGSDSDIPFFNVFSFPDNILFLPNFIIFEQIP